MRSKVSDWLPSYPKATRLVLEMLKMGGYFQGRRRMYVESAQDQSSSQGPCSQG